MWRLRCQATIFLSHSLLVPLSLNHYSPSLSSSHPLLFPLALCRGSTLTPGALMKSFQSRMWQSEMSLSDQIRLKQGPSYYAVRSTSLALCSVAHRLSQITIALWNHSGLPGCIWKEASGDFFHSWIRLTASDGRTVGQVKHPLLRHARDGGRRQISQPPMDGRTWRLARSSGGAVQCFHTYRDISQRWDVLLSADLRRGQ